MCGVAAGNVILEGSGDVVANPEVNEGYYVGRKQILRLGLCCLALGRMDQNMVHSPFVIGTQFLPEPKSQK